MNFVWTGLSLYEWSLPSLRKAINKGVFRDILYGGGEGFQKIVDCTTFLSAHLHFYKKVKTLSTSKTFGVFLQCTSKIIINLQMDI